MFQENVLIVLATAISGTPMPELLLTGEVEANDLAQEALRCCNQCRWTGHTTFQLWGVHSTTELLPPQRNLRRQCLGLRWCHDVLLGRYWETNDTRKRIKLVLTIYRDFMQNFLIRFWEEEQHKPRTTTALMFATPQSNIISFPCSKDFWLSWRKLLYLARQVALSGKAGTGAQLPHK